MGGNRSLVKNHPSSPNTSRKGTAGVEEEEVAGARFLWLVVLPSLLPTRIPLLLTFPPLPPYNIKLVLPSLTAEVDDDDDDDDDDNDDDGVIFGDSNDSAVRAIDPTIFRRP